MPPTAFDIVIPTIGRPCLQELLADLARTRGPRPRRIILVDDRRDREAPLLPEGAPEKVAGLLRVLPGRAAGPAAARNLGWRAASSPWIAFLDDDVRVPSSWAEALVDDLAGLPVEVAASQGRIRVPLPADRPPTDWERNVAGLESARWATADMAYRRSVLVGVGGFDERFPRAYREDADLGLRVAARGFRIVRGARVIEHPVRPASPFVSLRLQAGNADDVLMRAVHGAGWKERAGVPAGRRPRHLIITACAALAVGGLFLAQETAAVAGLAGWAAGTAELAWARIRGGPRTAREIAVMLATSVALPALASWHYLRGLVGLSALRQRPGRVEPEPPPPRVKAVFFDRDGTLIHDVPYNHDESRIEPVPSAVEAVARAKRAGRRTGVITNQSGVGRGLITEAEVARINGRVDELLGPFDTWQVCVHAPEEGCECRKPAPGLVQQAALELGIGPEVCALIGDIGSDVEAARAAGAIGVLVPTPKTLPEEIRRAPVVKADLAAALDYLLGPERQPRASNDFTGSQRGGRGVKNSTPRPDGGVLVARLDNVGDVLLTGPAVRAVRASKKRVTFLAGPTGAAAARLLPGVDEVLTHQAAWIEARPDDVTARQELALVKALRARRFEEALIFTSFHQSPLPLALLLRFSKISKIAAISEDYPGSLLDVRHRVGEMHEVERNLSLAATLGYRLPPRDDGRLRVRRPETAGPSPLGRGDYVVVHPGASVPARAWGAENNAALVDALLAEGFRVVVTGGEAERDLAEAVAGRPRPGVISLAGSTDLSALLEVLTHARAVICGNTGPAHLAAAVGTPVVTLHAPTVPAARWRPWGVRHAVLGDQEIACAGCRASRCPLPRQSCLSGITPEDVVGALSRVLSDRDVTHPATVVEAK